MSEYILTENLYLGATLGGTYYAVQDNTQEPGREFLHRLLQQAICAANELQVPVVIALTDRHGNAILTYRMPDALLVSLELAPKKAWTAVAMKTATHELTSAVQPGAALYGLESHMQGKVVTFGGGYALWREGLLLGGLGISGGSVEQDMDIAETAIAAINVRTHQ